MTRNAGISLIELLVAMAILGVVMSALLALTGGTISFTRSATVMSDAVGGLSDVTGYVGDRVRGARHVFSSATVDGVACQLDAATPCFAVVVGRIEGAGPAIDRYDFLAYRLVARSTIATALKRDNTWADANTFVLVEQRRTLCSPSTTTCTDATPLTGTTITGTTVSIVVDGVTLTSDGFVAGTTVRPFTVAGEQITLRFRTADALRDGVRHAPPLDRAPYTLIVVSRNS
jgi:prepilin-type N-terminal cleavage/methylation domain-containing protein